MNSPPNTATSAHETNSAPNPFTDYRMTVHFRHQSGTPEYAIPGYFAADGNAAESSADAGTQWRAHLSPDKPGRWDYRVSFVTGPHIAFSSAPGSPVSPFDSQHGQFDLKPTNKSGRDLRGEGRLQYVGRHHLRFAGSRRFFLKAGADSPESLLAFADFDNTRELRPSDTAPRAGEAAPKGCITMPRISATGVRAIPPGRAAATSHGTTAGSPSISFSNTTFPSGT